MIPGTNEPTIVVMVIPASESHLSAGSARARAGIVSNTPMRPRLEEMLYPENAKDEPNAVQQFPRL